MNRDNSKKCQDLIRTKGWFAAQTIRAPAWETAGPVSRRQANRKCFQAKLSIWRTAIEYLELQLKRLRVLEDKYDPQHPSQPRTLAEAEALTRVEARLPWASDTNIWVQLTIQLLAVWGWYHTGHKSAWLQLRLRLGRCGVVPIGLRNSLRRQEGTLGQAHATSSTIGTFGASSTASSRP